MAVTYTKAQREKAKADRLHLVTIAAGGIEFQGPVGGEVMQRVREFLIEMIEQRAGKGKPTAEATC